MSSGMARIRTRDQLKERISGSLVCSELVSLFDTEAFTNEIVGTVKRITRSNNQQKHMKTKVLIPMLALPFLFAACKPKETVTEKMDAGAEKVAEGVKEMATAAGEEAAKAKEAVAEAASAAAAAAEKAKQDAAAAAEKAKQDAAAAAEKVKQQAADAAAAAGAAVEEAKEDVKEAVEGVKEKTDGTVTPE